MITMEQALDTAMELPLEQRGMLADILRNRYVTERRREMAVNAEASLKLFKAGKLKSQSADELIAELHSSMEDDIDPEDGES